MLLTSFVTKSGSLEKSINKSVIGYGISFALAAVVYLPFSKFVSDYCDRNRESPSFFWKPVQWTTTGVLWSVWLQQDMSNLAIFLPRTLKIGELIAVCLIIFFGLGIMLYQGGEKIQKVVEEKSRVKDIPEATLVDLLYAVVLFVFKIYSKIPMSTTWCFVGLLAGREISIAIRKTGEKSVKQAVLISLRDLAAVSFGFVASLLIGMGANEHVREMMSKAF